jgi:hypothetical protein
MQFAAGSRSQSSQPYPPGPGFPEQAPSAQTIYCAVMVFFPLGVNVQDEQSLGSQMGPRFARCEFWMRFSLLFEH